MADCNSWHVTVNSAIEQTLHGMGVYRVSMQDMGMHKWGVCSVGVYSVDMYCVGVHDAEDTWCGHAETMTLLQR